MKENELIRKTYQNICEEITEIKNCVANLPKDDFFVENYVNDIAFWKSRADKLFLENGRTNADEKYILRHMLRYLDNIQEYFDKLKEIATTIENKTNKSFI